MFVAGFSEAENLSAGNASGLLARRDGITRVPWENIMSNGLSRIGIAPCLACVLAAGARADVSADMPLVDDGFELAAGTSIHGRGIWTDPRSLFRVQSHGAAQGGSGSVRVDTTEFADYGLPGFRNRWGGWISFAAGALEFRPGRGERCVLTLRGHVRISMPETRDLRSIRVGLVAEDERNVTVADIGMDSGGVLDGVVMFDGSETVWRSAAAVAQSAVWNEIVIRLDLVSGLGRLEWNGNRVLVFSHSAHTIARLQLSVDGRRSEKMPFRAQGWGEFDSVSASSSWHCQGDLNLDRVVDDEDFAEFVRMFDRGDCSAMTQLDAACAADLDRDRVVDEADFAVFASRYDAFVCP